MNENKTCLSCFNCVICILKHTLRCSKGFWRLENGNEKGRERVIKLYVFEKTVLKIKGRKNSGNLNLKDRKIFGLAGRCISYVGEEVKS